MNYRVTSVTGIGVAGMMAGLLGGCSPTKPAPEDPTLFFMKPGLQFLQFTSFDFSSDPELPACEQPGVLKQGRRIETFLMLERVDDQWVATLAPGQPHSVTLAFRYSGQRVGGRYGIAGTIQGEMQDVDVNAGGIFVPASDVRVRISGSTGSGPAIVDGFAQPSGTLVLVNGRVIGRMRFSTTAGDLENDCPSATWSLQNCPGTGDTCFPAGSIQRLERR